MESESAIVPGSTIVISETLRKAVCVRMYNLIGAKRVQQHVPLPHPVSLDRDVLKTLLPSSEHQAQYMVGRKDDGVRYLLLLMLHPSSGRPIALMIDRFFHMFPVSVYASKFYFVHGALFDGELVAASMTSQLVYLVFDVMAAVGSSFMQKPYLERRLELQSMFECDLYESASSMSGGSFDLEARRHARDNMTIISGLQSMVFRVKPFFNLSQIDTVLRQCRSADSNNNNTQTDGLIFMPLNRPITLGRQSSIFKWKRDHTIDLRFVDSVHVMTRHSTLDASCWTLLSRDGRSEVALEFALCEMREHVHDDVLIDCGFDHDVSLSKSSIWELLIVTTTPTLHLRVLRHRSDKDTPNDFETVERTLTNVDEAIDENELVRTLGSGRNTTFSLYDDKI